MWVVWIVIGIVTTTIIILNLWEKFQTNPTITGLDTDFHNWEVAFPALTICQHTPTTEEKVNEYISNNYKRLIRHKFSTQIFQHTCFISVM